MNIGIDIDGCLMDFTEFMWIGMPFFCKRKGIPYSHLVPPVQSDRENFNLTIEQENEFWAEDEAFNLYFSQEARLYASEVIKELKNMGHNIYIITARNKTMNPLIEQNCLFNLEELTLQWLENNNIYCDDIYFDAGDKVDIIKELKIDYMLEDYSKNVESIVTETDCKVFIFDNYSNRLVEDNDKITRVYSMVDWFEKFKKQIEE